MLPAVPRAQARGGAADGRVRLSSSAKRKAAAAKRRAAARARRNRVRVKRQREEGGVHWRIKTRKGVVHVWRPPGYRWSRAGIVVYVHGYSITSDTAWSYHRLAKQFKKSKQNALFIVVDGPRDGSERVKFPALGKVLSLVRRHIGHRLPPGQLVAMAHSSGIRTLAQWLDYRYLGQVILLDALFGRLDELKTFMTRGKRSRSHRMTLVCARTQNNCRHLAKMVGGGVTLGKVPKEYTRLGRKARKARILVLKSQYDHSEMAYNRKVIPLVLRCTRLGKVR